MASMHGNVGKQLHELGKNRYRDDYSPLPFEEWPEEWKTVYYKEYPRFPSYELPHTPPAGELHTLISTRKSSRNFTGRALSREDLSTLLKYSCGEFEKSSPGGTHKRRAHPSGGARYPIEVYVLLRHSDDDALMPGVYHYNIQKHALEFMWEDYKSIESPRLLVHDAWAARASAMIVLTGVLWRSQNKYQMRGYRYTCFEAGAIAQNLCLNAQAAGWQSTIYGGTNDDQVEELLALNPSVEPMLLSVLVG